MAFVWSSVPGAILATAAVVVIPEQVALALFAVSFVGLNLMHMGATWARVYVRPSWRSHPVERLAVPLSLAAFAIVYEAIGGGALLLALQYVLSFHHALMQNYGILRASQRRSRRSVDARLDLAACLLLPGAALLYRASAVCRQYAGAPLPSVPTTLVQTMAVAGAVALAAFAWREWRARRRGVHVDAIGVGMLFGTNLLWSALLVCNPHPALPLYALASGHYVQYLYFVWHAEAREPSTVSDVTLRVRLQNGLRSSRLRYVVLLVAMGGIVTLLLTFASAGLRAVATSMMLRPQNALDIPPWAAAMIGVNFEHYWLDHRIWRTRKRVEATVPAAMAAVPVT